MKPNIYKEREKRQKKRAGQILRELFSKTATLTFKKKKYTFYPVRTIAAIIAIILIISVICEIASGFGEKSLDVPFEAGAPYTIHSGQWGVLLSNNRGAIAVDENGKTKWQIEQALSQPQIDIGGEYTMLCDLAGKHYAASYKNGKKATEYKVENDIISAKVTEKGFAAIATDTDGYKGKVAVFNKRGREIYAWNSGSGYITDIDITARGRYLAVAQLVEGDGEVSSKIQFIDTSRGEVISTAERNGELAAEMKFVSDNKLIVVCDNSIVGYNKKGKELFCISLKGKSPSLYSIDSDDIIAVEVRDNMGNSLVEMYTMSGKFTGSYKSDSDIRHLATGGKRTIVVEQKGIVSITPRGKVKKIIKAEHDTEAVGVFESGKTAVATGSMSGEIFGIR